MRLSLRLSRKSVTIKPGTRCFNTALARQTRRSAINSVAEKACNRCGVKKALSEFYTRKSSPDGKRKECKACFLQQVSTPEARERINRQNRKRYESSPERVAEINASRRARRAASPEKITKDREASKVWRQQNPEKVKALAKRCYEARKGYYNARHNEYRRKNPHRRKPGDLRRQAVLKNAEGSFTAAEWLARLELYKGHCHWCHKKIKGTPHADHVVALAKGGTNDISNIVPACASCNCSKGAKSPLEFAGRLF